MRTRTTDGRPDLVLILERSEELPGTLHDLLLERGVTHALIDGSGRATWVTLDGGPSGSRRVGGPLELVHVHGTVEPKGKGLAFELRVVASREMDTGLEVVAGVLRDAQIEKACLRVSVHHSTTPAAVAAATPATGAWAAVAAASADAGSPDGGEVDAPRVGDVVRHAKFGDCVVRGIDDDHVRIRLEGGRTVSLGLSRLGFELAGELSTGKRIFTIDVKKAP